MSLHRIHAAAAAAVTACLLAVPTAALAATTTTTKKDPYGENTPLHLPSSDVDAGSATSGGGGSLVRTFVGLAVVIAVIYGLFWVLRQVKAGREEKTLGKGLQTTATVPLGPNRALHLVRAGTDFVLVGVAEQSVTPIRTYTEAEARAAGLLRDEDDDLDGDVTGGGTVAATVTTPRKSLRKMTIGEALERIRQATVRA
jgi:flagellar protein FliO/FliZ